MRARSRFAVLATAASFAASFLVASPAEAAIPFDPQCTGDRVRRCVRLDITSAGAVAIASITDSQDDSENFDVTVDYVELQAWDGYANTWKPIREASGDPGWQVEWDRAVTSGGGCDKSFRVVAGVRWQPGGGTSGSDTLTSKSAVVNCQ